MKNLLLLCFVFFFTSINIFADGIEKQKKTTESSMIKSKDQKNLLPPNHFMVAENGLATWQEPLVFISQNSGVDVNCYYELFGFGYGVVFDLSAYPDALAHSLEFHHVSMGLSGFWDYKLHIIDWDTKEIIATYDDFSTKGDDIWETNIPLDSLDLQGANTVAFLMEPLGNDSTDAYPDLSADNLEDCQSSIFGPLNDLNSFQSSNIGNFLMNIYIITSSGKKVMAPKALNLPSSQYTKVKEGLNTSMTSPLNKESQDFIAYNIYLDGEVINSTNELFWQYTSLIIGEDYTAGISALYENGESEIIGYEFTANETTTIPIIPSSSDLGLQIKPNPSQGPITLVSLSNASIQEVQIINLTGKIISTFKGNKESKQSIDLSSYAPGAYLIKVKTLDKVETNRIIIK